MGYILGISFNIKRTTKFLNDNGINFLKLKFLKELKFININDYSNLAGGRGTRLKNIKNKPKSLAKINKDTPFLKLQLDYFSKYKDIETIYLLTSNFESQIKRYVKTLKININLKLNFHQIWIKTVELVVQ